jgi:hypothetical protein
MALPNPDSSANRAPGRPLILIGCGVAAVVILIYLYVFGVGAWFVLVKGRTLTTKDEPSLWKTPVALKDLSISSGPGTKLSYFGYEFEVPWNDLDQQNTKRVGTSQEIAFHSGKTIWFLTFPPDRFVNSLLALGQGRFDRTGLDQRYGDEAMQSDYSFYRSMYETTPGEIGLFTPRGEADRRISLLLLKSFQVDANNGQTGIFLIENRDFRGFQYGNPQKHPSEIIDELFGDKARLHFAFRDKKGGAGISQAEINRVIQSARPVAQQTSSTDH